MCIRDRSYKELAANIDEVGLLTPLGVIVNGNRYTLFSGERRFRAITTYLLSLIHISAFTSRDAKPGKALNGDITLTSQSRHVKDGTLEETGTDDPLKALYWNTGIELIPPLDTFTTEQHTDAVTDTTVWKFDENTHWNQMCIRDSPGRRRQWYERRLHAHQQ